MSNAWPISPTSTTQVYRPLWVILETPRRRVVWRMTRTYVESRRRLLADHHGQFPKSRRSKRAKKLL